MVITYMTNDSYVICICIPTCNNIVAIVATTRERLNNYRGSMSMISWSSINEKKN